MRRMAFASHFMMTSVAEITSQKRAAGFELQTLRSLVFWSHYWIFETQASKKETVDKLLHCPTVV